MFLLPRGTPAPGPPFGLGPLAMSERPYDKSPQASQDRRAESREQAASLTDVRTRLVGGSDLTLLNYTSRSLYGQSSSRLLVGARISVRLATATLQAVIAGRVVRSTLTKLVDGVPRYEFAIALEGEVDWQAVKPKAGEAVAVESVSVDDADVIDFVPGHGFPPSHV
jgi:hypothetical protein